MLSQMWQPLNMPVLYAAPVFLAFIAVEAAAVKAHNREHVTGYLRKDTQTSLRMGLGSIVSSLLFKLSTLLVFVFLWTYAAPWHVPTNTWWSWLLLMVVVDFAWYWNHRFSHRVRIGWAGHQAHHSSQYFNLTTALRQKWNPWSEAIFWAPLPLLGFAPWSIYSAFMFNLIYQFFIHTELVRKLPRAVEFVLNTPSHHRVHHGSDPEYLDKNYGGILIIWDRAFGSFQEELHRPAYGLTKPVNTYNLFKLQYGEYANMVADVRCAKGLRNKLGYIFGPPGWQPERPRAVENPRARNRADTVRTRLVRTAGRTAAAPSTPSRFRTAASHDFGPAPSGGQCKPSRLAEEILVCPTTTEQRRDVIATDVDR
ncbi:C-5 sterol desaturase (plasmid) [Mycobacterium dioxanotrophicus]|uniref:C-5 sterol desaturase n=1 Tax=Mycobacterium dioxanotrophicus TaxID=482462 RepID=A0A1Y0CGT3_9MYCO|nr:C-5 sterol desaturase [Mycobacterium dioxanotrophicus]